MENTIGCRWGCERTKGISITRDFHKIEPIFIVGIGFNISAIFYDQRLDMAFGDMVLMPSPLNPAHT
jgi:hypothetical protein